MESINNNATPEVKEQLKNGNMGITAAYEGCKAAARRAESHCKTKQQQART